MNFRRCVDSVASVRIVKVLELSDFSIGIGIWQCISKYTTNIPM